MKKGIYLQPKLMVVGMTTETLLAESGTQTGNEEETVKSAGSQRWGGNKSVWDDNWSQQ